MSTPTLPKTNQSVNKNQRFAATHLVPLLIKREGQPDTFWYAPSCSKCGQVILDLTNANVSVRDWDYEKPAKLASFDGANFYVLNSDGAYVFCKSCDRSENKPWTPADCVFRNDQRRSFEKTADEVSATE